MKLIFAVTALFISNSTQVIYTPLDLPGKQGVILLEHAAGGRMRRRLHEVQWFH